MLRVEQERDERQVTIWLGYDADFADVIGSFVAILKQHGFEEG
jgi:hypothetical protein